MNNTFSNTINPKISVIVAIYNCEKYLHTCLKSLINQTFKDIEIICINDGSTDNSINILKEYKEKDNRIKIITQENKGAGGARNKGLELATGKYICITDADDYRSPNCLEKLYNSIEKYDTDATFCDYVALRENNTEKLVINPRPYNEVLNTDTILQGQNTLYQWQYLFKHDKIKGIRTAENLIYEDSAYLIQILMNINTIVHVDNCYYYYRIQNCSSSGGDTDNVLNCYKLLEHLKNLEPIYEKHPKYTLLKNAIEGTSKFFIKKLFIRVPFNTPIKKVFQSYTKSLKYLSLKNKILATCKMLTLFLVRKKKRKYYKYYKILNSFSLKIKRKNF